MSGRSPDEREIERLRETARDFSYPPTPDLSRTVRERLAAPRRRSPQRLAWAVAALLLVGLLAVPEVRASLRDLLRIGAVEIVPAATPPIPQPTLSATPDATPTPRATARPNSTLLRLRGVTTLEQAQQRVSFPLKQPTYPADLGPPDRVFVQTLVAPAAILVWLEPNQPDQVRLALYQLSSDELIRKMEPRTVSETQVNGQRALWTEGPYLLQLENTNEPQSQRLVTGNVLIWTSDGVTYRLESGLALPEAIRIAESLR